MSKSALLVMDIQQTIVDRYPDPAYLPRLRGAIGAARAPGMPVVYAVVGFRPGVSGGEPAQQDVRRAGEPRRDARR